MITRLVKYYFEILVLCYAHSGVDLDDLERLKTWRSFDGLLLT